MENSADNSVAAILTANDCSLFLPMTASNFQFHLPFEPVLSWLRAERTSSSGERWAWVIYDDVLMDRWHANAGGEWNRLAVTAWYPSIDAAITDDANLTAVGTTNRTSYTLPGPRDASEFVTRLHQTADTARGGEKDELQALTAEEEDLAARLENCDYFIARADVNGHGVVFIRPNSDGDYRATWFDDDGPIGTELARSSWDTEEGMTSGGGSISLILVADELGLSVGSGDDWEVPIAAFAVPGESTGKAKAVADWLMTVEYHQVGAVYGAALALEPLDPQSTLSDEALETWTSAIHAQQMQADFSIDEPAIAVLRSLLAHDATYRTIRNGLAQPLSDAGKHLLAVLVEGNVVTDL